jgi:hypothetical protein
MNPQPEEHLHAPVRRGLWAPPMTPQQFRKIALSLPGAVESEHIVRWTP